MSKRKRCNKHSSFYEVIEQVGDNSDQIDVILKYNITEILRLIFKNKDKIVKDPNDVKSLDIKTAIFHANDLTIENVTQDILDVLEVESFAEVEEAVDILKDWLDQQ